MSNRDPQYERHFRNALENYVGVLEVLDRFKATVVHDSSAPMPANWEDDPLVLLGEYLPILNLSEPEKEEFRSILREVIGCHGADGVQRGAEDVWRYRRRHATEIEFMRNL